MGWTANKASIAYSVPAGTPLGDYQIEVQGTNQGRTVTGQILWLDSGHRFLSLARDVQFLGNQ